MKKLKILAIACALLMTTNVHAALQSRQGISTAKMSQSSFFKNIRDMEMEGGTLGLAATLADVNGVYTETSPSNSIDAHMCKNIEWGAAAMLALSDYGAGSGNISGSDYNSTTRIYGVKCSTTGNMYGIFGMHGGFASYEFTAAGIVSKMNSSPSYSKYLISAPPRYKRIIHNPSSIDVWFCEQGKTYCVKGGQTLYI